jgi:hypothetical protein
MSARVQVLERFTGVFKLKHLVDDGSELDLTLIQKLAKVLMILLCAHRNSSIQLSVISQFLQFIWIGRVGLTVHEHSS